ncbi:MAG TPA: acetyl-CoA carboxylase biotin carboxylase subunit [Gaiellaceae bacterium]|nr:acetyl-CoA carboxylase biotin carboxylase subunit [Gaiellaceae bacterium]
MFNRVLVANRGEIAVRVIRALHELGIEAVAVYSTADEESLHVRLADRAVRIGPPAAAESYLRIPALIAAAETTGCGAVHPGYGFLSENADFVRACEDNDLVFIGPSAETMERMGDKARAKAEMRAAGVPLVPGNEGVTGPEAARVAAEELGFPVLLKAAAGGGGKGMRVVQEAGDVHDAYQRAAAEALAAFGDGSLYVEKVITPARHVEIQVLCDNHGTVLTCGERECSIQRRHQKLIEESPSPALDAELREEMEAAAERACRHIGYRNAGTIEFLVGPDGSFSFIEMNTRLQVEHPVTELVTSLDLVREQVRVASGEQLAHGGRAGPRSGHAIELRINAEDPARDFAPAPGQITRFRPPLGPGVRVDTFVDEGTTISPYYDSLIAKVIVHDASRKLAIDRAQRALGEFEIEGVPTTRSVLSDILASDEFRSGEYSTSFLEEAGARLPALAGSS